MTAHSLTPREALEQYGTARSGLTAEAAEESRRAKGANVLTKARGKSVFRRILAALAEPMLLILIFAWVITLGTAVGAYLRTGEGDFAECFGILGAIAASVAITVIMEGRSAKAFEALREIGGRSPVTVLRGGEARRVDKSEIVVGDVVLLSAGDRVPADARLIESRDLRADESLLTGESEPAAKDANAVLPEAAPLAERKNMVYSGTFIAAGTAVALVTAVGDGAEMGQIASELDRTKEGDSPLQRKLARLGKRITLLGAASAAIVFALSVVRLALRGMLDFAGVREAFLSSVILIVAAVPEGLPTIVAVSLALNVARLAKENALIRRLTAAETAGSVGVICSDKTGTLTRGRMEARRLYSADGNAVAFSALSAAARENFALNSSAELERKNGALRPVGNPTEGALLLLLASVGTEYGELRKTRRVLSVLPFSSETKIMMTAAECGGGARVYLKGAPEAVVAASALTAAQKKKILSAVAAEGEAAGRSIAFAHKDAAKGENADMGLENFVFDGFAVLSDPVRPDVRESVEKCREAGIRVMILTGDNLATARAVARETGVIAGAGRDAERAEANADEIEKMSDAELRERLASIRVIARSTPLLKQRVVRLLRERGEVVAVTGDGVNDAPALKSADLGVAMGSGSEVAKEASDVVLLDDSFSTVVRAVAFGRNVYRNLQRFIAFQLTVNLSAVAVVIASLLFGFRSPFTALQLLWINVIMDGPPALSLGFERAGPDILRAKPVRRDESIVSKKMLARILALGGYISAVFLLQLMKNFLAVPAAEQSTALFTLFVLLQLFNAFNCRELGSGSIFRRLSRNKPMIATFAAVGLVQFLIVRFGGAAFSAVPLSAASWVKILLCAFSVIAVSELLKVAFRLCSSKKTAPVNNKPRAA